MRAANEAFGHARCKRGERLISGGLRLCNGSGGVLPGQNVSVVESGPKPKLREWKVTMNSDLGGLARKDFVVFAYCHGKASQVLFRTAGAQPVRPAAARSGSDNRRAGTQLAR